MESLANGLYRALLFAVTALLVVLTVVVSYQVFGRYLPFIPRALWTEEISRLCLAWLIFLGAAVAVRRNEHFVLDVIPQRFEERQRKLVQTVILVFLALAALVMITGGMSFAETGTTRVSTTSGLRLVWSFAAIPVGGVCVLFFVLELAVRTFKGQSVKEFGLVLEDEDGGSEATRGGPE